MKYISTRGQAPKLGFEDVVLAGLAEDGGLYVPSYYPTLSAQDMHDFSTASFQDIALRALKPYLNNEISEQDFADLVDKAYSTFHHKAVTPLVQLGGGEWLLELYHGSTIAFKDVALQLLGQLFSYILNKRQQKVTIIGATSGDTGSAAIEAFRGIEGLNVFILYPHGRTSDVQRKQMTTVQNANVHALAVEGTFDDCQRIVKDMFSDLPFKKKLNLGAVNSINWARVMAQTVYYIQAACSLGSPSKAVSFSVPTGNFGDILAGYIAKKMGVPINQLIIATNENDILTRTFETGRYEIDAVKKTHSPSMDIQISSNFERLLFDLYNRDGNQIRLLMEQLKQSQGFMIEENLLNQAKGLFAAARVSNDETLEIIKNVYEQTGMLLDPHTAVGYGAAQKVKSSRQVPMVHLACAHAAKFPDIVEKATGIKPPLPHFMADLFDREEHIITLPNNLDAIKSFIEQKS